MANRRAGRFVHLEDDLRVYARAVVRYKSAPDQHKLALCVLAQRVLMERARVLRRPHLARRLYDTVTRINTDLTAATEYASKVPYGSLARVYPLYVAAGLV